LSRRAQRLSCAAAADFMLAALSAFDRSTNRQQRWAGSSLQLSPPILRVQEQVSARLQVIKENRWMSPARRSFLKNNQHVHAEDAVKLPHINGCARFNGRKETMLVSSAYLEVLAFLREVRR